MWNGSFALSPNAIAKVAQADTTSDGCNTSVFVELNRLEALEVDLHGAVDATSVEVGIRVAARLGLNLHTLLSSAGDGILHMLCSGGQNNNSRAKGYAQVVYL